MNGRDDHSILGELLHSIVDVCGSMCCDDTFTATDDGLVSRCLLRLLLDLEETVHLALALGSARFS